MARADADRNLVFGILALQLDFISREGLISAFCAWILDKNRPIDQILVQQGALSAARQAMLEPLVAEHVRTHNDDPEQSLAALSTIGSVHNALERLADSDLEASLARVPDTRSMRADPERTPTVALGLSTSLGQRFHILRPHAQGGLGVVFVARDEELNREVALKEIQDKHADDPSSRARFVVEAEITGGLEHPGIVPVYGLGHHADGRPFYVMRFIKGDNLKHAIRRFHEADRKPGRDPGERSLMLRQLLRRFQDVCNAVEYAHSRGVFIVT